MKLPFVLAVTCLLAASFAFGEAPVRQAPVADMTGPEHPRCCRGRDQGGAHLDGV